MTSYIKCYYIYTELLLSVKNTCWCVFGVAGGIYFPLKNKWTIIVRYSSLTVFVCVCVCVCVCVSYRTIMMRSGRLSYRSWRIWTAARRMPKSQRPEARAVREGEERQRRDRTGTTADHSTVITSRVETYKLRKGRITSLTNSLISPFCLLNGFVLFNEKMIWNSTESFMWYNWQIYSHMYWR